MLKDKSRSDSPIVFLIWREQKHILRGEQGGTPLPIFWETRAGGAAQGLDQQGEEDAT